MNETVKAFLPLVDFLEAALGPNTEIVLHDLSDPDHAVVDIRNGWISGRRVGAPATDLALRVLHDGQHDTRDFIADYISRNPDDKPLRSSSYIIRDQTKEVVGMLCINQDVSLVEELGSLYHRLASAYLPKQLRGQTKDLPLGTSRDDSVPPSGAPGDTMPAELLSDSTASLIEKSIADQAARLGSRARDLNQTERVDVIRSLEANGLFRLKGAVASAAATLGISEPSVYRYLQKIRKG